MASKITGIVALLNKLNHNIEVRDYLRSNGYTLTYIVSIDGKRYTTADQPRAKAELRKIMEAEINGK